MRSWEEVISSSEVIELIPGVDWLGVERYVRDDEWVGQEGYDTDPLEGPQAVPNFVDRPLDESERRHWSLESGWVAVALRLNALAEALGGKPGCAWQEGDRYFYQFQKRVH